MLSGLLETLDSHRPLVIAYFEALLRAERSPPLRTALAADLQAFRSALSSGIERLLAMDSALTSPDPQVAASLVMATFDGLIIQWLLDPERLPGGQEIAEALQRAATLAAVEPARS